MYKKTQDSKQLLEDEKIHFHNVLSNSLDPRVWPTSQMMKKFVEFAKEGKALAGNYTTCQACDAIEAVASTMSDEENDDAAAPADDGLSGTWSGQANIPELGDQPFTLELSLEPDGSVAGTASAAWGTASVTGTFDRDSGDLGSRRQGAKNIFIQHRSVGQILDVASNPACLVGNWPQACVQALLHRIDQCICLTC